MPIWKKPGRTMTFDPDHTYRGKIKKEQEQMWERLKEDPKEIAFREVNKQMRKMMRDMLQNPTGNKRKQK